MKFRIVEDFIHELKPDNRSDFAGFKKNLTNIYELEYKLYKIRQSQNFQFDKRLQNMIKIGERYLDDSLDIVLDEFYKGCEKWIEWHSEFDDGVTELPESFHTTWRRIADLSDKIQSGKYQSSTNEKMMLFHLAKNTHHQDGTMLDYLAETIFGGTLEGYREIPKLFDELSNFDTSICDKELKEQGVEI